MDRKWSKAILIQGMHKVVFYDVHILCSMMKPDRSQLHLLILNFMPELFFAEHGIEIDLSFCFT